MKAIERVPIVQQVADNLREFILSGDIQVGEKMPTEMALCEMLGVGRGTVREALRILQANGFIEIQPGKGAFVAKTEETGLDDIFSWFAQNEVNLKDCMEVRSAIDPLSIKLAIERCTDKEIDQLQEIHNHFLAAAEQGDAQSLAKYDEQFHNTIIEFSHNKLLKSINKQVTDCIAGFRDKTFLFEQNVKDAVEPHTHIMDALRTRDADAGELFMRKHIQKLAQSVDSSIRK